MRRKLCRHYKAHLGARVLYAAAVTAAVIALVSCDMAMSGGSSLSAAEAEVVLDTENLRLLDSSGRLVEGEVFGFTEFSSFTLTVKQGMETVSRLVARRGREARVPVPYGTGYTLEVRALVNQSAADKQSYASSYFGVSAPFDVVKGTAQVSVQLSLDGAVPVDYVLNDGYTASVAGISGVFGDPALADYGFAPYVDYDKYGRIILTGEVSSGADGNTSIVLGERGEPPKQRTTVLGEGAVLGAYDAYTDLIFVDARSTLLALPPEDFHESSLSQYGIDTGLSTHGIAAPDGKGGLFLFTYASLLEIRKYSLSYGGRGANPVLAPLWTAKFASSPEILVDARVINDRLVLVMRERSSVGYWKHAVCFHSPVNGSILKKSAGILSGETARIIGYDKDGVWLYTAPYTDGGGFSVPAATYHIDWEGAFNSPPPAEPTASYSISIDGGLKSVFVSAGAAAAALRKAIDSHTGVKGASNDNPLPTVISGVNISTDWGMVATALDGASKYVALDLSLCTADSNTVAGAPLPYNNDMNIIKDNMKIVEITLPASLTRVGDYAFYGCTGLLHVDMPSLVTAIGNFAFSGSGLIEANIPERVERLGNSVYADCAALESVSFPRRVSAIGTLAFDGCAALTRAVFAAGSVISDANFGAAAFPEGADSEGGDVLKTAYRTAVELDGYGAGVYVRDEDGALWDKSERDGA